jgi:hypothetical protein
MQVPVIGSVVKILVRNEQGSAMIPPQPTSLMYEGKVLPSYTWLTDRQFCLSGTKDWPIRVLNMDYIENIELLSGTFKEVNTDTKVHEVLGSKGKKYIVTSNNKGWTCTCPGFQFRKQCKHVSELSK